MLETQRVSLCPSMLPARDQHRKHLRIVSDYVAQTGYHVRDAMHRRQIKIAFDELGNNLMCTIIFVTASVIYIELWFHSGGANFYSLTFFKKRAYRHTLTMYCFGARGTATRPFCAYV